MKQESPAQAPLRPASVDNDGTPTLAQMLDVARARCIKDSETIKTLRRALRDQRDQHKTERSKLRREIRESQLLYAPLSLRPRTTRVPN